MVFQYLTIRGKKLFLRLAFKYHPIYKGKIF